MYLTNIYSSDLETIKCASNSSESDRQDVPWDSTIINASQSSGSEYYEEKHFCTELTDPPIRTCHSDHQGLGAPAVEILDKCTTSVDLPPISWHGYNCVPKFLSICNTGRSILIRGQWSNGKPYIQGGPLNGSYIFSQIHFHCPSEHQIDGKRYPLEMHVVHYKTSYLTQEKAMEERDGTVVLVYLFQVMDSDDTVLSWLTKQCPRVKGVSQEAEIAGIALNHIVKPFYSHYYIYWGSVSTKRNCYLLQWIINCTNLYATKQEVHDLFQLMDRNELSEGRRTHLMKPVNNTIYYAGGYSLTFRGLDEAANHCSNCYANEVSLMSQCCQTLAASKEMKKDAQLQVSLSEECNDFIKLYFPKEPVEGCNKPGYAARLSANRIYIFDDDNQKRMERDWNLEKLSDSSVEISVKDLECTTSHRNYDFESPTVHSDSIACMKFENNKCPYEEKPKKKRIITFSDFKCDKLGSKFFKIRRNCNTNKTNPCNVATNTNPCTVATNTNPCTASTNTNPCTASTNTNPCTASNTTNFCSASSNTKVCSSSTKINVCSATNEAKVCSSSKVNVCSSATTSKNCTSENKSKTSICSKKEVKCKEKTKSDRKVVLKKNKKDAPEGEKRRKSLLPRSKVKSKSKSKSKIPESEKDKIPCEKKSNETGTPGQDCTVNFLFTPNSLKSIPSLPLLASESEDIENGKASAFKTTEETPKASASANQLQKPKAKEPLTEFCIQTEHLFRTKNNRNFSSCTTQDYNVAIIYKQNVLQEFKGTFSPNKLEVGKYKKLDLLPEYSEPENIMVRLEDCTVNMKKLDELSVKAKFLLKKIESNTTQAVEKESVKQTTAESLKTLKAEPKTKLPNPQKKSKVREKEVNNPGKSKKPKLYKDRTQKQLSRPVSRNGKTEKGDSQIKLLKGPPEEFETSKSYISDTDQLCDSKLEREKSLKSLSQKSDNLKSLFRQRRKTVFFSYEKVDKDENMGKKVLVGRFRAENEMKVSSEENKPSQNNETFHTAENSLASKEESFFSLPHKEIILGEVLKCEKPVEKPEPAIEPPSEEKQTITLDKEKNTIVLHYYNPEKFISKNYKNDTTATTSQEQSATKEMDIKNIKSDKDSGASLKIKIPKSSIGKDAQVAQLIIPLDMDTRKLKETSIELILSKDAKTSRNKSFNSLIPLSEKRRQGK